MYACQRHRAYLFGKTFKIYSEHKALVNLLSRPYSKAPLRIESMVLQLQGYDFDIKYVKSEQNISVKTSSVTLTENRSLLKVQL